MKKIRLILFVNLVVLMGVEGYAQVGVKIQLPMHPFHVDPKENTDTKAIKPADVVDDFVVTKEGNVGLGTVAPEAKLDINGKIKMKDGTQGADRVMMGDANGVARWESLPSVTSTVIGKVDKSVTTIRSSKNNMPKYSNVSITLPKGKWIVTIGLTLENMNAKAIWLVANLSSSKTKIEQNGWKHLGVAGSNSSYAANLPGKSYHQDAPFGLLTGSSIVEVTDASKELYVMIGTRYDWSFPTGAWENFIYAIPVL